MRLWGTLAARLCVSATQVQELVYRTPFRGYSVEGRRIGDQGG